jgi:hypothetical protein
MECNGAIIGSWTVCGGTMEIMSSARVEWSNSNDVSAMQEVRVGGSRDVVHWALRRNGRRGD